MNDERFSAYMALDGPHLDGLIGSAGVLRFDWPEKKTYIQHFEGISAAHNVSIAHNGGDLGYSRRYFASSGMLALMASRTKPAKIWAPLGPV